MPILPFHTSNGCNVTKQEAEHRGQGVLHRRDRNLLGHDVPGILTDQKAVSEYTLKQYDVDSAYDVVIGYEINCLNGETVERTIHSHLIVSDKNEFGFRVEDSLTAEPVSVPGMEKAVFILSEQKPRLIMIRKLDTPVRVKTAPLDYLPDEKNETTEYCYELITVNGFSLEESADLFSIQK